MIKLRQIAGVVCAMMTCCASAPLIPDSLAKYAYPDLLNISEGIYKTCEDIKNCICTLSNFLYFTPSVAANSPEASDACIKLIQWNNSLNENLEKNKGLDGADIFSMSAEKYKAGKLCLNRIYKLFDELPDVLENATIINSINSFDIKQITDKIDPEYILEAQDAQENASKLKDHLIELKKYHEQLKTLCEKALNAYHVNIKNNLQKINDILKSYISKLSSPDDSVDHLNEMLQFIREMLSKFEKIDETAEIQSLAPIINDASIEYEKINNFSYQEWNKYVDDNPLKQEAWSIRVELLQLLGDIKKLVDFIFI